MTNIYANSRQSAGKMVLGWKHATDTKSTLVNVNIYHLSYNKHYISNDTSCLDLNDMLSWEDGETSYKMVAAFIFSDVAYFCPTL